MTVIGEDSSERLDVIPAQFRVIVTKRPKLACRTCAGTVMQAPAPARLIEGGIPTEALVAHVLVARYEPPRICRRLLGLKLRRHGWLVKHGVITPSASAGGMLPMGSSNRRWLNQSTHSNVANSTASNDRQGLRRWITSPL